MEIRWALLLLLTYNNCMNICCLRLVHFPITSFLEYIYIHICVYVLEDNVDGHERNRRKNYNFASSGRTTKIQRDPSIELLVDTAPPQFCNLRLDQTRPSWSNSTFFFFLIIFLISTYGVRDWMARTNWSSMYSCSVFADSPVKIGGLGWDPSLPIRTDFLSAVVVGLRVHLLKNPFDRNASQPEKHSTSSSPLPSFMLLFKAMMVW